jgi:hypothetical protein
MPDIEPLEPVLWFGAVRKLAQRAERMGDGELERLLRHAYHLLQLTPRHFRSAVATHVSESAFEALLDKELFEEAAHALAGGSATGSPFPPATNPPEVSEGSTRRCERAAPAERAAAHLLEWTRWVLALEGRSIRPQTESRDPGPHKEPSALRLRLIEH